MRSFYHHGLALLFLLLLAAACLPVVRAQVPTAAATANEMPTVAPGTLFTRALPSSTVTDARVGPGDVVRVTVFGQNDLSAEIGVNEKGQIVLALIGPVDVNGLSPGEMSVKIADAYRAGGYLRDPAVSVEVLQIRSQLVSILGQVSHAGRYAIPGRLSVLELIAMAGGLTDDAELNVTLLRRPADGSDKEGVRIPIQLGDTRGADRAQLDAELHAGDVVYVNKKKSFYIHGEVNRAGNYMMEPGMNVMRAIALGGGMNVRASQRRITITRFFPESGMQEFKASLTDPLLPGDVVFVNESLF